MSNKLNYSTAAHLIHSRMELVRVRLETKFEISPVQFFHLNQKMFEKAGMAVLRYNGIGSSYDDFIQAAALMLESERNSKAKRYYIIIYKDESVESDDGSTLRPADPKNRWSHEQAREQKNRMVGHYKIFDIHIVEKWHVP